MNEIHQKFNEIQTNFWTKRCTWWKFNRVSIFSCGKKNIHFLGVDVLDIVEAADGFAQVAPKHKYFIVDCLQKRGHITGMTGDGVK